MNGRRKSAILKERDSGNNPLTRIHREFDYSVHEKHQAYRLLSIQEVIELISEEMKILSEAKLPIYQKSQWPTG